MIGDRQARILRGLYASGPLTAGRVAVVILDMHGGGRRDTSARNTLRALEHRGYVRGSFLNDEWRLTDKGRAWVQDNG